MLSFCGRRELEVVMQLNNESHWNSITMTQKCWRSKWLAGLSLLLLKMFKSKYHTSFLPNSKCMLDVSALCMRHSRLHPLKSLGSSLHSPGIVNNSPKLPPWLHADHSLEAWPWGLQCGWVTSSLLSFWEVLAMLSVTQVTGKSVMGYIWFWLGPYWGVLFNLGILIFQKARRNWRRSKTEHLSSEND